MEVDQYGSAKKSASRPKMQRIQPDHLTDRELLVLGILSIWRARWTFFFAALPDNETKVWTGLPMRIFESSLDIAAKISAVSTSLGEYEAAFRLEPSDPKYELFVGWMKTSLSVALFFFLLYSHAAARFQMLASISINLLHTRTDVDSQRLWSGVILRLLEFFARKTDVSSLFAHLQLSLTLAFRIHHLEPVSATRPVFPL